MSFSVCLLPPKLALCVHVEQMSPAMSKECQSSHSVTGILDVIWVSDRKRAEIERGLKFTPFDRDICAPGNLLPNPARIGAIWAGFLSFLLCRRHFHQVALIFY
jgi:hypothetical protein